MTSRLHQVRVCTGTWCDLLAQGPVCISCKGLTLYTRGRKYSLSNVAHSPDPTIDAYSQFFRRGGMRNGGGGKRKKNGKKKPSTAGLEPAREITMGFESIPLTTRARRHDLIIMGNIFGLSNQIIFFSCINFQFWKKEWRIRNGESVLLIQQQLLIIT